MRQNPLLKTKKFMSDYMDNKNRKIIAAWNDLSEHYQKSVRISTDDVHYGALSYGEKQLNLIGPVNGKKVLEVGCGGGQNTIALARQGAHAVGVDPSTIQLAHALSLAKTCNTDAAFVTATAEDLPFNTSFDVVLSSSALCYIYDIKKAFKQVHKILKKEGIFVLCMVHPYFLAVGYYLSEEPDEPEIRNYLSWPETVTWDWICTEKTVKMWGYYRTLSQIMNALIETGFTIEKIVEQGAADVALMSEKEREDIPYLYEWGKEYAIQRKLPHTLILKLRK